MMLYGLAIVLALVFGAGIGARSRGEKAVAFTFACSFVFLLVWGKNNSRYVYTLYPFLVFGLIRYSWKFVRSKSAVFRWVFFLLCAAVTAANVFPSRNLFLFYGRYKVLALESHFPAGLLAYIKGLGGEDADSPVLVQSDSILFFYHLNRKGVDYRDRRLAPFYQQSDKALALEFLKNKLNIHYIYVSWNNKPSGNLAQIIRDDCDLVYIDGANGIFLYRIRDKAPDKASLEKIFVNDSLLKNGSFENWTLGPDGLPDNFNSNDNIHAGMVVRDETAPKIGRKAVKIAGDNFNLGQTLPDVSSLRGKPITVFVWMKTDVPDKYRIQIYDGVGMSFSTRHSGRGGWELLLANHTIRPDTTTLLIRVVQAEKTGRPDDVVFVDGALAVEGDWNTFYLYVHRTGRTGPKKNY